MREGIFSAESASAKMIQAAEGRFGVFFVSFLGTERELCVDLLLCFFDMFLVLFDV